MDPGFKAWPRKQPGFFLGTQKEMEGVGSPDRTTKAAAEMAITATGPTYPATCSAQRLSDGGTMITPGWASRP